MEIKATDGTLFVLIETYWNVKFRTRQHVVLHNSINRNILECKELRRITSRISGI